jgi:hypothetical protein
MTVVHAVEVRPPFWVIAFVEFAVTLPAKLNIRGSQQKVSFEN